MSHSKRNRSIVRPRSTLVVKPRKLGKVKMFVFIEEVLNVTFLDFDDIDRPRGSVRRINTNRIISNSSSNTISFLATSSLDLLIPMIRGGRLFLRCILPTVSLSLFPFSLSKTLRRDRRTCFAKYRKIVNSRRAREPLL